MASLADAISGVEEPAQYAIVGIATHGGLFTPELRQVILEAVRAGLSIVNGLHDAASDDAEIAAAAAQFSVELVDLRKPKPKRELHFWTGEILKVKAPRIALLGTDCALGKRTTSRFLVEALNAAGLKAEMIYTGQTGWMQGVRYGFVFDSVINDFVSGELEHAIVSCDRDLSPDVIVIEGQSSLRNPSGPCGAEFLVSGGARGVIMQHAAGREFFDGYEEEGYRIPPLANEIELLGFYGARALAVTLNGDGLSENTLREHQHSLQEALDIPVVCPLQEGVEALVPVVRRFIAEESSGAKP